MLSESYRRYNKKYIFATRTHFLVFLLHNERIIMCNIFYVGIEYPGHVQFTPTLVAKLQMFFLYIEVLAETIPDRHDYSLDSFIS